MLVYVYGYMRVHSNYTWHVGLYFGCVYYNGLLWCGNQLRAFLLCHSQSMVKTCKSGESLHKGSVQSTLDTSYLMVIFFRRHERRPITPPPGGVMGCLLWVQNFSNILPLFSCSIYTIHYYVILDNDIYEEFIIFWSFHVVIVFVPRDSVYQTITEFVILGVLEIIWYHCNDEIELAYSSPRAWVKHS